MTHELILRLRKQKNKAVDRMEVLHNAALQIGREFTQAEQSEFDSRKAEAEDLVAAIEQLQNAEAATVPSGEPAMEPAPTMEPALPSSEESRFYRAPLTWRTH